MITFIILHYNNIEDTIECINSLKKFDCKIIIVSNSQDYENLEKIKSKVDKVIINKENLGFAKANNIGCSYAIKKYNPDFLSVINNDIIINQEDFITQIKKLYNKYQFDVLGPKILPEESESNNPFKAYKSLEEINEKIKYTKKLIKVYNNVIIRNILNIYLKIKKSLNKQQVNQIITKDVVNEPLHGCALIFSKKYYERYKDIFYNKTFLYHEEEFLYYRCIHDDLKFVYSPSIELIHKEGMSLNKEYKNNYKKLLFRNKEILKSLQLLKEVYEKGDAI